MTFVLSLGNGCLTSDVVVLSGLGSSRVESNKNSFIYDSNIYLIEKTLLKPFEKSDTSNKS